MRFQSIVLLTSSALSLLLIFWWQQAKSVLLLLARTTVNSDLGGRRQRRREGGAWYQSITKLFKPNTASNAVTKPELACKSLIGAYKSLKLNKIKSVDELFSDDAFDTFNGYNIHLAESSSAAKFFSNEFEEKMTAKLFARAAQSSEFIGQGLPEPVAKTVGKGQQNSEASHEDRST
ncbi:hypothetical protein V7S43_016790 [Phytophthora oleae]|uniref:RxLR effector protein n=1 Tax=Phytophthora oleae TaxID=2107226 RepID=A0ABD3EYW6_9STRA